MHYLKISDKLFLVRDVINFSRKNFFNFYIEEKYGDFEIKKFNSDFSIGEKNRYYFLTESVNECLDEIKLYQHDIFRPSLKSSMIDCLYFLSLYFFNKKEKNILNKILLCLGDTYLLNLFQKNNYNTFFDILEKAVSDKNYRMLGGSFLKIKNDKSLLEILYLIKDNPEFKIIYPVDNKLENFKREKEELCEVLDIVWNSDQLNLSFKLKINGFVELPEDRLDYGLPKMYPTFIYRYFPLVKNGKVCLSELEFTASSETLEILNSLEVIDYRKDNSLQKMNISSSEFFKDIGIGEDPNTLFESIVELNKKQAILKVLKENKKENKDFKEEKENLEEEFLKKLGITKNGYFPKVENKNESYMEVKEFKTYLKGISSFPKVSEVLNKLKENKKISLREEMIKEAIESSGSYDFYKLKKQVEELENYINTYKILCLEKNIWVDGSELEYKKNEHTFKEFTIIVDFLIKKIKK